MVVLSHYLILSALSSACPFKTPVANSVDPDQTAPSLIQTHFRPIIANAAVQ